MFLFALPSNYVNESPACISTSCRPKLNQRRLNNMRNIPKKMPLSIPLRPILIIRHDADDGATSPTTKLKKRVMFADEMGNQLTEIKFMSEPSNYPPRWNDEFVARVTGVVPVKPAVSSDKWELMFPQPIADYVKFRSRLEDKCVAVENVILKQHDQEVMGTLRVKNLAFDKRVFVRVTFDSWATHEDIEATHVESATAGTRVYELFDSFSFFFKIPSVAANEQKIEFCASFQCNLKEYWDNNNGENYKIILTPGYVEKKEEPMRVFKYDDAFKAQIQEWTEFASWQHLYTDSPYW